MKYTKASTLYIAALDGNTMESGYIELEDVAQQIAETVIEILQAEDTTNVKHIHKKKKR
jgi:hypothetical protein